MTDMAPDVDIADIDTVNGDAGAPISADLGMEVFAQTVTGAGSDAASGGMGTAAPDSDTSEYGAVVGGPGADTRGPDVKDVIFNQK